LPGLFRFTPGVSGHYIFGVGKGKETFSTFYHYLPQLLKNIVSGTFQRYNLTYLLVN